MLLCSCDECIVPIPVSSAVFELLFERTARGTIAILAATPRELSSRDGYESFERGVPLTRYDLLQAVVSICDELDAIEIQHDPAQVPAQIKELAAKQVELRSGGWLEAVPRAFVFAAQYCTQDFLDMITGLIDAWGLHTQSPILQAISQGDEQLTLDNVRPFTLSLLQAAADGLLLQMRALKEGIGEVLPLATLRMLQPDEMCSMFCGEAQICWEMEELMSHMLVPGRNQHGLQYSAHDAAIAVSLYPPV